MDEKFLNKALYRQGIVYVFHFKSTVWYTDYLRKYLYRCHDAYVSQFELIIQTSSS